MRRELARRSDKLTEARAKLAALEPGGASARPEPVDSASQIEGRAEALTCLRCDAPLKVKEHRAITDPRAGSVRELELLCPRCGTPRTHYYQVHALH